MYLLDKGVQCEFKHELVEVNDGAVIGSFIQNLIAHDKHLLDKDTNSRVHLSVHHQLYTALNKKLTL